MLTLFYFYLSTIIAHRNSEEGAEQESAFAGHSQAGVRKAASEHQEDYNSKDNDYKEE